MSSRTDSAAAFMAESCSGLSSSLPRRKRGPEYIQPLCEAAASLGPLWAGPHTALLEGVDDVVEAVVASVVVVDALHAFPNPIVPISGIGRPLDGNGAARTEVIRRSIPVAREKERIFFPLLICK